MKMATTGALLLLLLGYISLAASLTALQVRGGAESQIQQVPTTANAASSSNDYGVQVPTSDASTDESTANPLWPSGVSKKDIDKLVNDILADRSINVLQIPDFVERQIYRTTILLTLNSVYRSLGDVHGMNLWGHSFVLTRDRCKDEYSRSRQRSLTDMKSDVDEELLEEIADQLLANQAIDQSLVPNAVERQLYVNCLKIVFRLLNMLAASLRITVCGHDLTLSLEKSINRGNWKEVARKAISSDTHIDTHVLNEVARAEMESDGSEIESPPFWRRGKKELVIQVHSVLYSLILGIVDDLLANTELQLMSDRIKFDIVAPSSTTQLQIGQGRKKTKSPHKAKSVERQLIATFLLGTSAGIAIGWLFLYE